MNTQKQKFLSRSLAGLILAIYAVVGGVAQADTQYATGGFTWGTDSSWSATSGGPYSLAWTSGNDATFEGTAGTVSLAVAGVTAHNLTFNTTGFIVTNNTLTLLGTTPTLTTGEGISATLSLLISTSAGLTKAGTGTVKLTGANTFTSGVTINEGTIELAGPAGALASDVAIGSSGTLLFNRTANYVFAKSVSGSGALRQSQAYVELTANNPFTGTVTIDASKRMVLVNANAFAGAPKLVLNGQLTLGNIFNSGKAIVSELSGSSSGFVQNNYSTDGVRTLEVSQTNDTTFAGTFQDSGTRLAALLKSGTGTLTLGGASTHTGGTTIKEGALKITGSLAGNILVDTNGTLMLSKAATFANAISGTGVIKSSLFGDVLITGNNTFSGILQLDSDTRIVLNGTGAEDGEPALYMKGGQFTLGNVFVGSIATFRELSGSGEINANFNSGSPRTLSINQATSTTYTGTLVSTSSRWVGLAKSGVGTLTLAGGANAINSDDVTVSGGTLQVGAVEASTTLFDQSHARTITVATNGTLRMLYRNAFGTIPSTPTTKLVINGGTMTSSAGSGGAVNILQDLTLKNGGVLEVTKGVSFGTYQLQGLVTVVGSSPSAITNTGSTGWVTVGNGSDNTGVTTFDVSDVTGNAAADLTIAAVIKDSGQANRVGALTKTGAGALLLSSTNLYTGTTTVSNGTLRLGINNTLRAANHVTLAGGALDVGSTTNTLGVLTLASDSTLNLDAEGMLSFAKSASASWAGKLTLTGSIDFNRLRIGEDATGLNPEQLGTITWNGYGVGINASGYLYVLRGTIIRFL